MVIAISQKTKMIEQVVTFEGDLIQRYLQQVSQDIQNSIISSTEKECSLNLSSLEEQVERNRTAVLNNTLTIFGTY
jgi:LPS O-antigen subunit length determinant protein (WzzB/FepE family)